MKRKRLSAIIMMTVAGSAYSADWGAAIGNVDNAPTQSNIEQYKQAVVDQVKNKESVSFSTDSEVGANNQSSSALSSNVTSSDWMKNINDTLTLHSGQIVNLDTRTTSLEVWTGAGGFTSALDMHTNLKNSIDTVDTDLQSYKVDTDDELNRHETALQSATTYTGTLASATTAKADNVAANSVGTSQIKNNSIRSSDIRNGTLKGEDIGNGEIGNGHLAADAVTSDKVLDGTLTGADLADESIDGTKVTGLTGADITDGSLSGDDVSDGSLTGLDVADGSLTGQNIQNGSVDSQDLTSSLQATIESGGEDDTIRANATPSAEDKEIFNYLKSRMRATVCTTNKTGQSCSKENFSKPTLISNWTTSSGHTVSQKLKGDYGLSVSISAKGTTTVNDNGGNKVVNRTYYSSPLLLNSGSEYRFANKAVYGSHVEFSINGQKSNSAYYAGRKNWEALRVVVNDSTKLRYNPYRLDLGMQLLPE